MRRGGFYVVIHDTLDGSLFGRRGPYTTVARANKERARAQAAIDKSGWSQSAHVVAAGLMHPTKTMYLRRNPPSAHLARLPEPGKYAKAWKRISDAAAGKVVGYDPTKPDRSLGRWGDSTASDVAREYRRALQRRISERGGERYGVKGRGRRDDYSGTVAMWLRRDHERLKAWRNGKRKTQWGLGFETKEMRARFPEVDREMRDASRDNPRRRNPSRAVVGGTLAGVALVLAAALGAKR